MSKFKKKLPELNMPPNHKVVYPTNARISKDKNSFEFDAASICSGPTSLKPQNDFILIDLQKAESQTQGGIYLPETTQEKPNKGIVVAVGPGTKDHPMPPGLVGKEVIFSPYQFQKIENDGKEYIVCRSTDLIAVVF